MDQTWIDGIGFSIKDKNLGEVRIEQTGQTLNISYPCSSNFICTPYIIIFPPGIFFIQIFGASGGFSMNDDTKYRGGYGGVTEGVYITDYSQRLFLFIGGSGENYIGTQTLSGGFNGGGQSFGQCGGGGGGTDIRASENLSPDTRIVVAGGGGGGRYNGRIGGNGGGIIGEQGNNEGSNKPCYGSLNGCIGGSGDKTSYGSIGNGGNALTSWGDGFGGGGGGGGYYGGGSAGNSAGSGGSGFIGELIVYHNHTTSSSFSDHEGNGYAIITIIKSMFFHSQCRNIPGLLYLRFILV